MITENTQPAAFSFESKALDPDTFEVTAFHGREEISRPYCFEIDLVADDPDIDMGELLFAPATFLIEKGEAVRKIHGILTECGLAGVLPHDRYCYHVVLRPRIWLLAMNRQNQIYQKLTVPQIVEEEIKGSTAEGCTRPAAAGLTSGDYELRLTRDYPEREYTVQYGESDLDFISRLMEHEGLYYFFEQGDTQEKMIITDNNIHFAALSDNATIAFRPPSGLARSGDEAVLSLNATTRRVPRKLVLKDYNYRTPHVPLQAEADVDEASHGLFSQYGEHFKTPEEGAVVARIRSQEIYCARQIFDGISDSIRLQPGWRFTLDEHFRETFNVEYVVTHLVHEGRQPLAGASGRQQDDQDTAGYSNRFTCIPSKVAYRPPRRTPRPVVSGLMNAHVDAALLEDRAEIDDQGRYKLIMPFDLCGAAAGQASRYVRKAQPYGGRDMGMHFPLHKGTEVVCTFVNGDPDRPIIVGVVPNPLTPSVVHQDNHTKNILRTAHGSYFEFNDGKGSNEKDKGDPSNNVSLAVQQQRLAAAPPQQGQEAQLSSAEESSTGSGNDIWFRINLPDYDTSTSTTAPKTSYLRLGARPANDENFWTGTIPDGWFDYTDGDRTSITIGNKEEKVMSEEGWCSYEGIHKVGSLARKISLGHTSTFSSNFGTEESYFGGSKIEGFLGVKTEIAALSALESFMGFKCEAHCDWNFQIGTQGTVNLINGDEWTVVDAQQTFGTELKFHVVEKDLTPRRWTVVNIIMQLLFSGVVGAAAGANTALQSIENTGTRIAGDITGWSAHGVSVLAQAVMLVYSIIELQKAERRKKRGDAKTQLNMSKDEIELKCGKSSILLKSDGTVFIKGDVFTAHGDTKCEIISPAKVIVKGLDELTLDASEIKLQGLKQLGLDGPKVTIKGQVSYL